MVDCPCGVLLLICGPPACGKTHMVKKIVASASSRAETPCAFVSLSFDQLYPPDARNAGEVASDSQVSARSSLVATDHTESYPFVSKVTIPSPLALSSLLSAEVVRLL